MRWLSGPLSGPLSSLRSWLLLGPLCCAGATGAAAQPATAATAPSAEALAAESRVQLGYALRTFVADIDRIERVSFALLRAAAPYCDGRRQASAGASPRSTAQVPPPFREAAADIGLDARPRFNPVLPGSPLAQAGVQPGDVLLALGGDKAPAADAAPAWFQQQVDRQWAREPRPAALTLTVERAGRRLDVPMTPQPLCTLELQYVVNDAVNAAAAPGQLLVASGMLRFAPDDGDLAVVLGHELAHALLRHPEGAAAAARARGDLANAGAAPRDPYRQDKERDADRLGLFLTAAAGYDATRAGELWRRMAARAPGAIQAGFGASHPSTPERFLRLQALATELAARQARGESLTPPLADLKLQQDEPGGSNASVDAARPGPLPSAAALRAALNDEAHAAYLAFLALRERPRALALSPRGHVALHGGDGAEAEALAACNALARGSCRLVALDDGWLGAPFLTVEAEPAAQSTPTLPIPALPTPAAALPNPR